ncbi:VOC family protein [Methylobacterium sp. Leaf118]|uniref:VOC family protein n=1 Tax=Methylobacterium sp. Leaf118 TaxID=2876562 RepID=UPI001E65A726|nr:VOC family protein [Methylobacterium sp. Leaf118]
MIVEAIILETLDWTRAVAFYEGLSGEFGIVEVRPVPQAILWDPSADFLPRIIVREAAPGADRVGGIGGIIVLCVDDIERVDRAHDLVIRLGAGDVEEARWYSGIYAVRFSDPDGHRFEIAMVI